MIKIYHNLIGVLLILGLATLSVFANLKSNMQFGAGWGILAVLTWIFWSWKTQD